MVKIAVLASFNMDLVMRTTRRPDAGETLQGDFSMHLGGKGFNQAVAARRLGADVAVIGRVGEDEFGRMFLAALDREGIDRSAVAVDASAGTGVASIIVEGDGTNTIIQAPRANRNVSATDIERAADVLANPNVAIYQLETSIEAAMAFAKAARAAGVTTLFNPAPVIAFPPVLLRLSDIVIVNEIEAVAIVADAEIAASSDVVAHLAAEYHIDTVVVTRGGSGATATGNGREVAIAAMGVDVVDTTGAGDAFCAAFAVRTAEGDALDVALRYANAAGAAACTVAGAEPSMPPRDEVEALLMRGLSR